MLPIFHQNKCCIIISSIVISATIVNVAAGQLCNINNAVYSDGHYAEGCSPRVHVGCG